MFFAMSFLHWRLDAEALSIHRANGDIEDEVNDEVSEGNDQGRYIRNETLTNRDGWRKTERAWRKS
jgi:hypothetical protein